MSMIIAKRINENGQIDIQKLRDKYPKFCVNDVNLLIFINRIFNEKYTVVRTPKITIEAPIVAENIGYVTYYRLNLFNIMAKYGIPKDYYIETIASNFVIKSQEQTTVIPVFPNEIVLDCDYGIEDIIKKEIEYIQKVGETYEVIGKLHHVGLVKIADDLREAIIRSEKGDVDGSIKFFRKVIEGFESWVNEDVVGSSNRADVLKKYLKKAYHLLSNFGEHAGTEALMNEAVFSKEIAISIAKYLIAKTEE